MNRRTHATAGLFIMGLGLGLAVAQGCGSNCPIDTDGDGTITQAELLAIPLPVEFLRDADLLGCQSLHSLEDLNYRFPEIMLSDLTVDEGEVFIVDASGLIDESLEVLLWPDWQEFSVRRLGPLRWEVTAPMLGVRDETVEVRLQFFANFSDAGAGITGNPLGEFLVTVLNTSLPADALSGWWNFSTCPADLCRLEFRFDGDGALVDWRWYTAPDEDPEMFIPRWQDVTFSGSIDESGVSFEFSGKYFDPYWESVQQLEQDRYYFDSSDVVDRLSLSEKEELVRRTGAMRHYTISFANSAEPYFSRIGELIQQQTVEESTPIVDCTDDECDITFEEMILDLDPSRIWTELNKRNDNAAP